MIKQKPFRGNWCIVRKHPWNIDLSNLQSYSNWKNMRIHIGSCTRGSAPSGAWSMPLQHVDKRKKCILFVSRNKTQCKRQTLQWNSQSRWTWQCLLLIMFYICKQWHVKLTYTCQVLMRILEPLCESKEVEQTMFPKNEAVFAALASQSVASPESRPKKHSNIQVGWKPITPVWFASGVTKKMFTLTIFFVCFGTPVFLWLKKRRPLWILFAEKTWRQTPQKKNDMVTKPKMDLGNLALTTLIWFSQLS